MKLKLIFFLTSLILSLQIINAQTIANSFANEIKPKNLKKHVYILASDSCAGRNVGTKGIAHARDYIFSQWEHSSNQDTSAFNSYFQPFTLLRERSFGEQIKSNEHLLNEYDDYMYWGKSDNFNKKLPMVFAGYGAEAELKNMDVNEKAVFFLINNLRAAIRTAKLAQKHGASFSIFANPEKTEQFESISRQQKTFFQFGNYRSINDSLRFNGIFDIDYRYITISSKSVKKITSKNINYWKRVANKKKDNIKQLEIPDSIKIFSPKKTIDTIISNNIISTIPGIDPDSYIIVGAHYDHLGIMNDEIYYGADDNASGTAAVIELSKAIQLAYKNGYKPRKNIVFVAFSAEEGGMCGSKHFVNQFSHPEQISLMLNIDMIGRCDGKHIDDCDYFYFIANNLADSLIQQNNILCKKYKLSPDYSSNVNASDHKPFAKLGIPTIFYFDGKHRDLHKPTDTRDKIDYYHMAKISKVIFETIWVNAEISKYPISISEIQNN